MATYVLIPGAGGSAWYWHLVDAELRSRGHDVVAVDLPAGDDTAGLAEYTDAVVDAIGDRRGDLVLVAQSLGGFTAPLVCDRVPVDLLVLVAAMVPAPGESAGDWWENTGQPEAMHEQAERDGRATDTDDWMAVFFHDVPAEVVARATEQEPEQSGTVFTQPWPLERWPDVPTRFLLCRDDRLFPAAFQRQVVQQRLGIVPDEMDSGHLPALSRPGELADRLEAYWTAHRANGARSGAR
jgi:pimeloyl-ACP methyl ester carboxylesterase